MQQQKKPYVKPQFEMIPPQELRRLLPNLVEEDIAGFLASEAGLEQIFRLDGAEVKGCPEA